MPPRVGIVLGSTSDEEKAKTAAVMLEKFGVEYELEVLSAARIGDLVVPGQVLLRLAVAGFGVTLPPD